MNPVSRRPLEAATPAQVEALVRHFGSEAAAAQAITAMDLHTLAQVPGLSEKKATELVRTAHGLDAAEAFFATAPARKLRDEVLERLCSFAATAHGRNRLGLLAPLPDPESCAEVAHQVMAHKKMVAGLDRDRVRRLLRRIHKGREPTPRAVPDRLVVCESEPIEDRWRKAGLGAWCAVGGQRDLSRAADAELVIALYDEGFELADVDHVVEVPATASWAEVVPESVLAWFTMNREVVSACAELATLLGRPHKAGEALQLLDEAQRQRMTPATLRATVEEVRTFLDGRLKERVASLQLSGTDLLDTLGQRLPGPLQRAMDEVLAEGRQLLRERTGQSFQPFASGFPVGLDEKEIERVESKMATQGRLQEFQGLVRIAKRLSVVRSAVEVEVGGWLSFDADFALGCFALHHDLRPARFGPELALTASVHLSLADSSTAQRISYEVGGTTRVALLTGANSGGKTTLLEHMAQLALMARLGLPVVGDATVPWVEELHYVTARRSLDAGAFEGFLRAFLPLATGDRSRLVLADEVEAVTEMEAAGRILGFFLDRLTTGPSIAVVVSHMAPHILGHCKRPEALRVDGIEASGLDADHRLVVERQPKLGHLARSTPELIVARLAATTRGRERDLYDALLATFPAGRRGPDVGAAASASVRVPVASPGDERAPKQPAARTTGGRDASPPLPATPETRATLVAPTARRKASKGPLDSPRT